MVDFIKRTLNQFSQVDSESLGKTEGFLGKKSYLSYNEKSGWEILYLTLFQRLSRFLFGSYQSTHLKNVAHVLSRETQDLNPILIKRMETIWNKTYPRLTCPFKTANQSSPIPKTPSGKEPNILFPLKTEEKFDVLLKTEEDLKTEEKFDVLEDPDTLEEQDEIEQSKFVKNPSPLVDPKASIDQIKPDKSVAGKHYKGLPGEWYQMTTSQVKEDATNACTSIALFTINEILANPANFNPESFFNQCIIEGSKKHLKKYGKEPLNRFPAEVIKDLNLQHLNQSIELTYDPELIMISDDAPISREDLTDKAIQQVSGKPFVATLNDGRETIALYYKSAQEIYVLDSHERTFRGKNHEQINLSESYVVKLTSKAELDDFLFNYRYWFDMEAQLEVDDGFGLTLNNGANQIEMTIFPVNP